MRRCSESPAGASDSEGLGAAFELDSGDSLVATVYTVVATVHHHGM